MLNELKISHWANDAERNELWRELVETVTFYDNGWIDIQTTDGETITLDTD